MVRTLRNAKLDSPSGRAKLTPAPNPYWSRLGPNQAIGYHKPRKGAGTWRARLYNPLDRKFQKTVLGAADDYQEADNRKVFSYQQAQGKAEDWFKDISALEAGEKRVTKGVYTVANAMSDYLKDAERRCVKGLSTMRTTINAHILPPLGEIEVGKLTKRRIEQWLDALAEAPRRKTGKVREEVEYLEAPTTENEKRARKDSANRILTNLKSGLNYALTNKHYSGSSPWREVKNFKGVGIARVKFLSVNEQRRLVNVCPPGFRELVQAALYTGCRYSEICRLKVRDFDTKEKTIFIEKSKSGHSRYIWLTPEGSAWFTRFVAGKSLGGTLLIRPNAKGCVRKHQDDPLGWGPHDQKRMMQAACIAAGIEPMGFHELRHTYASGLVNAGIPLAYIASQLGHVNTAMVEKHYGHLSPSAMAKSIRKLAPKLGIMKSPKVEALKISGSR